MKRIKKKFIFRNCGEPEGKRTYELVRIVRALMYVYMYVFMYVHV